MFVAVWPPEEVNEGLAALAKPELEWLRWTAPHQWHITMSFLGEVDEEAARAVFSCISPPAGVVAEMGPHAGWFGHRVLQLPVSGLEDLSAVVRARLGSGADHDRDFNGHITLARVRRNRERPRRLADVSSAVQLTATWPVLELTLVRSGLSRTGAHHEVVDALDIPLGGDESVSATAKGG